MQVELTLVAHHEPRMCHLSVADNPPVLRKTVLKSHFPKQVIFKNSYFDISVPTDGDIYHRRPTTCHVVIGISKETRSHCKRSKIASSFTVTMEEFKFT